MNEFEKKTSGRSHQKPPFLWHEEMGVHFILATNHLPVRMMEKPVLDGLY
jgi:hypothetical protein